MFNNRRRRPSSQHSFVAPSSVMCTSQPQPSTQHCLKMRHGEVSDVDQSLHVVRSLTHLPALRRGSSGEAMRNSKHAYMGEEETQHCILLQIDMVSFISQSVDLVRFVYFRQAAPVARNGDLGLCLRRLARQFSILLSYYRVASVCDMHTGTLGTTIRHHGRFF